MGRGLIHRLSDAAQRKEPLHGRMYFPTTKRKDDGTDVFFATIAVNASFSCPSESIQFRTMGSDGRGPEIHFDPRISQQSDCLASVISSVQAWLKSLYETDNPTDGGKLAYMRNQRQFGSGMNIWIYLDSDVEEIGGASEGLAVLLALLGFHSLSSVCVTGFVQEGNLVGNLGMHQLLVTPIQSVDCVPIKIKGCLGRGISIGFPEKDSGDQRGSYGAEAKGLKTVGDAMDFITRHGATHLAQQC